jgi:hypothetical protein
MAHAEPACLMVPFTEMHALAPPRALLFPPGGGLYGGCADR